MPRIRRAQAFLFEPAAFVHDPNVQAMTLEERGAYIVLLCNLWQQPEPGMVDASNDRVLAQMAMCTPKEWAKVRLAVSQAFDHTVRVGWWSQLKMIEVARAQEAYLEGRAEAGRKGGKARARVILQEPSKAQAQLQLTGQAKRSGLVRFGKEKIKNTHTQVFVPPSLEEVREYIASRKSGVSPEKFVAFYESKGWMVGKNRMRSWKAAVITWELESGKEAIVAPGASNAVTEASRREAVRAEAHKWAVATGRVKE